MILIPPVPIMTPYYLQSVDTVKEVITTNDATIQGILLGVILAIGSAFIFLYIEKNKLQKKYNDDLADVHKNYQAEIKKMHEDHKAEIRALNEALYSKMEAFQKIAVEMNANYHQYVNMINTMQKNER